MPGEAPRFLFFITAGTLLPPALLLAADEWGGVGLDKLRWGGALGEI
jgi:hypothetical protein